MLVCCKSQFISKYWLCMLYKTFFSLFWSVLFVTEHKQERFFQCNQFVLDTRNVSYLNTFLNWTDTPCSQNQRRPILENIAFSSTKDLKISFQLRGWAPRRACHLLSKRFFAREYMFVCRYVVSGSMLLYSLTSSLTGNILTTCGCPLGLGAAGSFQMNQCDFWNAITCLATVLWEKNFAKHGRKARKHVRLIVQAERKECFRYGLPKTIIMK